MSSSSMFSLCGGVITSRRGLLASLWSLITILTVVAFLLALVFTLSAKNNSRYYYNKDDGSNNNYYDYEEDEDNAEQEENGRYYDREMAVTSRAMAFATLWTAVLATLMSIFGTVILGWQSPTGIYYTCCSPQVHRTTPLALGSFIGSLMMFANLTLACSVLFGEFEVRDYRDNEQDRGANGANGGNGGDRQQPMYYVPADTTATRSSTAFSVMCMFLTVVYGGFAALAFILSEPVLDELAMDEQRAEALASTRSKGGTHHHFVQQPYDGYIGERFDIQRRNTTHTAGGFVAPTPPEGTMA